MNIDSHQHFWRYQKAGFEWITDDMKVIQRDFLPTDLAPLLAENDIEGCVTVQVDQTENETDFLLNLADQYDFIKGVVGWVDFKSEKINERLFEYSRYWKLKGFRHIVQGESKGFLLQPDFIRGIRALKPFNFTYDILVYAHQLEDVIRFLPQVPDQKFVVDHLAKPSIKAGEIAEWSKHIKKVAAFENVYCKLSGMVTEAKWKKWNDSDFRPYLDTVFECFGARRLMYGSDWPVCLVGASYHQQRSIVEAYLTHLSHQEKEQIRGGNAVRFYNL